MVHQQADVCYLKMGLNIALRYGHQKLDKDSILLFVIRVFEQTQWFAYLEPMWSLTWNDKGAVRCDEPMHLDAG